jgi:beta-lactamase regulating signal transducer with metallopeptidase domain
MSMKPIPEAIAWTLLHFCWQAAAIAALYRISSFAVARRTSQARYLLALSAMLLMFGAALATFLWQFEAHTTSPHAATASFQGGGVPLESTVVPSMASAWMERGIEVKQSARLNLLRWIDGLWLLGVVAFSLRSFGGWWLLERLCRESRSDVPSPMDASFARIAGALGIRRLVRLRISDKIGGPATVGALRAMVLVPLSAITLLSADELEMVLAHELAHVRRADFFWNLVQKFIETLFFFHPAVWWLGRRISRERELCCDDLALKVCPHPLAYASALFRLEEQRARQWRLAMALDGHQSGYSLRLRIARILGEPQTQIGTRSVQPVSLPLGVLALAVALLSAPQMLAGLRPATPPVPASALALPSRAPAPAAIHPLLAHIVSPVPPSVRPVFQDAVPSDKATDDTRPERTGGSTYIDQMRAAGYGVDLDKLIAMKIQDVTPAYARAMAQLGFGKPTADDLIACKIHGVTPEYLAELKQRGLDVKSLKDAISYRIFGVTPEFVAGMKDAGFADLNSHQLMELRVQGVTPEYARQIRQQFPGATVDDIVKTRIFGIDGEFIARAKKFGFDNLSLQKLVQLRISGVLDDETAKP